MKSIKYNSKHLRHEGMLSRQVWYCNYLLGRHAKRQNLEFLELFFMKWANASTKSVNSVSVLLKLWGHRPGPSPLNPALVVR